MAGMISLIGGIKYRFMHLTIWVILHVFFPIVSSLIKTGEDTGNGLVLLKPQYEWRVHRQRLEIRSDWGRPDANIGGWDYSTLGDVVFLSDWLSGQEIDRPWLGLKLKGGRCDLKRKLGFSCFMEKLKRKLERLGTLVILLVIHPITPSWVS